MSHKKSGTIRNVRAFIKAYVKSDSGKAALNRRDYRKDGKTIVQSNQMAQAFLAAVS